MNHPAGLRRPHPAGAPDTPGRPRELRLSEVEFDACWELLGLGERPGGWILPSPGRTHTERRRVLDGVLDGLRRRDLARDRPHPMVADLLEVLARPRQEIDLLLGGGRSARAAIAGGRAVVAARHGGQVWTVRMRPAEVVPRLVALVGPMTPGVVRPVNIPAGVLDEALRAAGPRRSVWAVADELASRGVPKADATGLARAFGEVHDIGQLGVSGIVEGRRHPGPWAIGFHRADSGWIGTVRRPEPCGHDGGGSVSVFPLDAPRLATRLDQLLGASR